MTLSNLTFNNKNSYTDFRLTIEKISIQPPSKKKIKDSVPFQNGSYDFSTVGSGGDIVYTEREIKITFNLINRDKTELYSHYTAVLEWLFNAPKGKMLFNFMPGYYFLGEVENAPNFEEVLQRAGKLEVMFICDPYKYGIENYGKLLWNNVDFLLPDYIQQTTFNIIGSKTVIIGVPGNNSIVPDVIVTANMNCTLNGYTANFTVTKSKDYKFKLKPGLNTITIIGTGNIDFQFQKKVI